MGADEFALARWRPRACRSAIAIRSCRGCVEPRCSSTTTMSCLWMNR